MIICKKCGNDNPLGRVFCSACGGKLDLTDITRQVVEDKTTTPGMKITRVLLGLVKVIAIVIALVAALAAWPDDKLLGEAAEKADGRSAENAVIAINKAPKGAMRRVDLTGKALNGFLIGKAETLKMKSMSASMVTSAVTIRVSIPFKDTPFVVAKKEIRPFYSMDITLLSTGGAMPVAQSARLGHLPMFGPLKGLVVTLFAKKFQGSPELEVLKLLTEIKIDADKLSITVKK